MKTETTPMPVDTEGEVLPVLEVVDIMKYIPHRPPFLLVDRVTHHIRGKRIEGVKNVTMNEPYFEGHFPNKPIMPGMLQLEALAQVGSVMIAHLEEAQGKLAVFAGIEKVRFRKIVVPGDQLILHSELTKFRPPIGKARGLGYVDGELAVEADIMFSLIDG